MIYPWPLSFREWRQDANSGPTGEYLPSRKSVARPRVRVHLKLPPSQAHAHVPAYVQQSVQPFRRQTYPTASYSILLHHSHKEEERSPCWARRVARSRIVVQLTSTTKTSKWEKEVQTNLYCPGSTSRGLGISRAGTATVTIVRTHALRKWENVSATLDTVALGTGKFLVQLSRWTVL